MANVAVDTLEVIERVLTENGEIQLQKRNGDYEIIFNGSFLMATYNGDSERLMVQWAIEEADLPRRVLIAGLGVGFSLGAALKYPMIETVKVVEIEKKIIEWNRAYLSDYSNNALNHPKVCIENEDFIKWMMCSKEKYDVICLDIDNGPDWIIMDKNDTLYSDLGIRALIKHLNQFGVISFWSASKNCQFEKWLKKRFKSVIVKEVSHESGMPDYIYLVKSPKSLGKMT